MNTFKKIAITTIAAGSLVLGVAVAYATDWAPPLVAPPTCTSGNPGCDAPINVSATGQVKNGPLIVCGTCSSGTALTAYGDLTVNNSGLLHFGSSGTVGDKFDLYPGDTYQQGVKNGTMYFRSRTYFGFYQGGTTNSSWLSAVPDVSDTSGGSLMMKIGGGGGDKSVYASNFCIFNGKCLSDAVGSTISTYVSAPGCGLSLTPRQHCVTMGYERCTGGGCASQYYLCDGSLYTGGSWDNPQVCQNITVTAYQTCSAASNCSWPTITTESYDQAIKEY